MKEEGIKQDAACYIASEKNKKNAQKFGSQKNGVPQ